MMTIRKTAPLAVLGLLLFAALAIVALALSAGVQTAKADDPDGVIVGIDMDTTSNTCPQNVAGLGADCTLGAIDTCVSVTVGTSVDFDVFVDDLDLDSHLGHGYDLDGWPASGGDETAPGTPPQISNAIHQGAPVLLTSRALSTPLDFSEAVPDTDLPYNAAPADIGTAEYNPPYTQGVLDRYTVDTTGATPGVYGMTLSNVTFGRDTATDAAYPGYPVGGNVTIAAVWDFNFSTPYGILAVGVPCPEFADVEIVSQQVRASDCTSAPPTEFNVGVDTDLCLRKSIVNNGPTTPVDVDVDAGLSGPGDCTITPDPSNPTSHTGLNGTADTVDELFTVNCTAASTHAFTFTNEISPTDTSIVDTNLANNAASTPYSANVLATADLAVTSVTVTAPATANATTPFVVQSSADVTNASGYTPVNASVSSLLDFTGASGCSTPDPNPAVVNVVGLGSNSAGGSWNVTCATEGLKTFNVTATATITTAHVDDSDSGNDSDSGSDQTDITAPPTTADAQILSWVFPDEMGAAGNQVRVVPGVNEDITSTETLDNNDGTYPGASYDVSLTVDETPAANCSATPDGGNPTTQTILTNGTDVVDTLAWSVGLTGAASCGIVFAKTVTITTAGITDTDLSDNTANRSVTLVADTDDDTVPDNFNGVVDNCPNDDNPNQADNDLDDLGDVCDPDDDDDTVPDATDNCPLVENPDQLDTDGDGVGDACGADFDGDTVLDNQDNCRAVDNPSQTDSDSDGLGNACDNCPSVANANQLDTDADGIGDVCEVAPTVTVTATPTAVVTGTPTGTATGTATPEVTQPPVEELCAPVIPGTYNGLVRLNGVPAADGFVVTASIGGTAWGDAIVSGGRYALDVPETLPASPPCFEGGTITFTLDGGVCEETPEWASGLHDLDLNCAPAPPPTTPAPPISTVTPPVGPGTPIATPIAPPPSGGGGLAPLSDLPWVTALAAGAVLAWVLAAAGIFHGIRRRVQ